MLDDKKLLIADDDDDILESLRFSLDQLGFNVITAGNGFEAFALVGIEKPDLVILDVMMPKENGYIVSRTIKESIKAGLYGKNIPVILLTARVINEPDREQMFMNVSMADVMLYKPMDLDILAETVKKLLSH